MTFCANLSQPKSTRCNFIQTPSENRLVLTKQKNPDINRDFHFYNLGVPPAHAIFLLFENQSAPLSGCPLLSFTASVPKDRDYSRKRITASIPHANPAYTTCVTNRFLRTINPNVTSAPMSAMFAPTKFGEA
ncbi:hypothetical protein SAMN02927903_00952 [Flavobacterium caeni]|uniref:Uncharacterized protein n=1 Tax=Flavobacterium caeni TaxID=490189 RepID=A0A1G5E723_9FLAO|nr:hypothetical protein SAMN02927903_00952 [Flavobacterium caeni]